MIIIPPLLCLLLLCGSVSFAQTQPPAPDPTINNLIHLPGYKTSEYGAIPHYIKAGHGRQALILIPGLGFDAAVFNDFMEANKKNYIMYAITIPGYGKTMAPPMPDTGTSYGEQSWNRGTIAGIAKLIEKEKIHKPIVVGHFTQGTQLAFRMAIDHPDKVSGVIILGGPAKFVVIAQGAVKDFPLKTMVDFVNRYTAPTWFKSISKKTYDNGNYQPVVYSLDSVKGTELWKQSAAVPLPVMVRYSCEFFASDIKIELGKIRCPVLVLRALFNSQATEAPATNYLRPQFIDIWNDVSTINPLIIVKDIEGAASFVWKDKPGEVNKAIKDFTGRINY